MDEVYSISGKQQSLATAKQLANTLGANDFKEPQSVCYVIGIDQQGGKSNCGYGENVMPTLCSDSHGTPHAVCYAPTQNHCGFYKEDTVSATLQTRYHYGNGGDAALVVLNDQGGSMMNTSNIAGCLRAQDHGHPPVICFEPGIMSRDTGGGNRANMNLCSTLRAVMGDNQPAVCFQLCGDRDNPSVSTSDKAYCLPANPMSDR